MVDLVKLKAANQTRWTAYHIPPEWPRILDN